MARLKRWLAVAGVGNTFCDSVRQRLVRGRGRASRTGPHAEMCRFRVVGETFLRVTSPSLGEAPGIKRDGKTGGRHEDAASVVAPVTTSDQLQFIAFNFYCDGSLD